METRQRFKWVVPLLRIAVRALTPTIEKALENAIHSLYEHALKTENDIDNIFVELLADLLDIEL